ncbi:MULTISPECIES: aldehyde dehydrogenase family protein [Prochlorococcus]|uniref:Aldehyde dehydrogenase n=1 Tax=Prochlorococcus marinus (strain SARG / CCMP1375 / SS120) TaxID=167539 RepID=Q7VDK2_PROMA|nr:NAD-dependent aldehyde dehydrogenase [Prochlorococcus marinus subsp. marinus str. CCMP1375]KGG11312.1 Aldehyde dehydrogenase [Prochlorococcus marinus str. LG]KGG18733.1 Aldehyde dehydrogenase [Prochlorococcus marinus str. SS2]KGG23007.1 Aldehyde dehydrogenase [Prochlorococcus marinus str. SS35]KGG33713.1 Aldehyde dehydrogenase [Prochlorococcus marinus str. SS51]KGG36936.1 Aldehyde dehydrogenase [Prochlorococcus sp. SS52]
MIQGFQIENLRNKVVSGHTRSESWRRAQLKKIKGIIDQNQKEILNALSEDLQKPSTEAFFEILSLRQELQLYENQLSSWMKPQNIKVPLWLKPGEASVIAEPLGCVLIIGAWNYPFMLTLQPLISALAAGNTAILKPSEYSPATSELIEQLFTKYFPPDIVKVCQGDEYFAAELLKHKFDHIFFTGGSETGKKVMSAASKYLTPITLELGGKNPALVLKDANIDITAKRLIWGKSINSGQTCLAPNHLLVHKDIEKELIEKMKYYINSFYGKEPQKSKDLAKINDHQFEKIISLIEKAQKENKIISGGEINSIDKKVSPTLIHIENLEESIISDELFGPIFPILSYSNFDSALNNIRSQEKSLAIYMFGGNEQEKNQLLSSTSSGGVCFNDVVIQAGIPELPFGGIGLSGIGRYHGKAGFETFSHLKSILKRPFWLDLKFRYPPYKIDISFMSKLMR